jgi:hypothetical protein
MDRSLRTHVISLEQLVQELGDRVTEPQLQSHEIARIRHQIRVVELALAHYRKAYELEQRVLTSQDTKRRR